MARSKKSTHSIKLPGGKLFVSGRKFTDEMFTDAKRTKTYLAKFPQLKKYLVEDKKTTKDKEATPDKQ